MKIVFFDVRDSEKQILENFCKDKYDYILSPDSLEEKTNLSDEMKQAEIISCFTFSRVTKNVLQQFPNLKLIALRCVGFNHIDIDYCKEHNIQVVNSLGYGNITVAEFAFGLMFDVMRKITRSFMDLREEHPHQDFYTGFEFNNKTIGIIGTGAIGSEAVRIAKGIGMDVLAYDIYPKNELVEKYGIKYVELDELLKESDVISLHAPLTDDNFHLINDEKIRLMKPNAVLLNTARGELIDTKALYSALVEHRTFGAGLDVLEAENMLTHPDAILDFDYLTEDYIRQTLVNERLLKLPNVVVTPHIAYNTKEAQDRILHITASNIEAFLKGNIVNSVIR